MTSTPTALVCREVFDENSQPSFEEISEYAQQIGIDPVTESHLLPLARDGLMQALPAPWKAYYDDKLKSHYFYNSETRVTQWDHPLDQVYKNLVIKAKLSSERGDSILDDTCVSIQDLVTYEEDAKQIPTDKCETKDKMENQDSSLESSLEEEMGAERKIKVPPDLFPSHSKSGPNKLGLLTPLGKKPLPPVLGLADRRSIEAKRPGDSNTFPRTTLTTVGKYKTMPYHQKDYNLDHFDNSDSEGSHERRNVTDAKWSTQSTTFGNSSIKIVKHTPEIIDLSFNPSGRTDSMNRDSTGSEIPKRGITLSGGGSVFLKSNRIDNSEGKMSYENPKGILRERSFGETGYKLMVVDKSEGAKSDTAVSEEDRKSVRFNLEQKEADFQYDYSPSPSSNSSSDMLHGKQESVIAVNRADNEMKESANPNAALVRRNSDISGLNTEVPNMMKIRKLRPLKSDDNIKVNFPMAGIGLTKNLEMGSDDNRSLKDVSSITNSPTRKLIRPLPGDFIKPSLFQKPFEKLSDILKPSSPDTDSESEISGIKSTKPPPSRNKLSINLMESLDSEASIGSPDKESVNFETTSSNEAPKAQVKTTNGYTAKRRDSELMKKRMDSIELRRKSLDKMSSCSDSDKVWKDSRRLDQELAIMKEKEINSMRLRMEAELKEIKYKIEEEHQNDIADLKTNLEKEHAKNKVELQKMIQETKHNHEKSMQQSLDEILAEFNASKESMIEEERTRLSEDMEHVKELLNKEHSDNIERLKQENKNNLQKLYNNMEHDNIKAINELGLQYAENLEAEKIRLANEKKSILDKMKSEHEAMCDELKKDYRSEVELVRSQQAAHLSALRERLRMERERPASVVSPPPHSSPLSPRDEVAFERLRCDKRLLEDKYRCLKEKYARLKNDVKISIERRNKRREQSLTTGSETEKSHSHKTAPALDKSSEGNEALKNDPRKRILTNNNNSVNGEFKMTNNNENIVHSKPPIPDNNNAHIVHIHHHRDVNLSLSESTPQQPLSTISNHHLNVTARSSSDHSRVKSPNFRDKSPLGKFASMKGDKSYGGHCDNDNSIGLNDISLSQSDSHTVSNSKHAKRVHVVEIHKEKYKDNGETRGKGVLRKGAIKSTSDYVETTVTDYQDSSDTGLSDHAQVRESLVGRNRKKLFTRLKSASTSRLNYTVTSKHDHASSPLENLRQQLRKLEELEEQFPDVTLNADTTAYRLRYPFPDSGGGGELGFLRHRALVEREGVRRAKVALRRRSDSLKQRKRSPQPWQDECELTDMEVSLHRTKSILGEKVIRLRHIEKSLRKLQTEREGKDTITESNSPKQREDNKDTTLSDISSHSSGFSSTEAHSDGNHLGRGSTERDHEAEIISSLQTLNTEIKDIWQVLNAQQQLNVSKVFPIGQLLYTDVGWQLPIAASHIPNLQSLPNSVCMSAGLESGGAVVGARQQEPPHRLQLFRQLQTPLSIGRPQLPVPVQASMPSGVATSLVERTRDLRDWLKQQAAL